MRHLWQECRRRWGHGGFGGGGGCPPRGLEHRENRPGGGGYATSGVCIIGKAAVGTVLAACGAGGDRAAAYPKAWRAGDRSSAGSSRLDHFPGIAAQCRHPRGRPGLSGNDRAVACRPLGAPAGQAGGQSNPAHYVQERLTGTVVAPDGAAIHGPAVTWRGRRYGRRQDRRWATAWSPEQISRRMRLDFPEDQTMHISHEAIYQALLP